MIYSDEKEFMKDFKLALSKIHKSYSGVYNLSPRPPATRGHTKIYFNTTNKNKKLGKFVFNCILGKYSYIWYNGKTV